MIIVRDADVRVKSKRRPCGNHSSRRKDLQRLFSSRPIEVIFKIKYPDEAEISQTIPIVYQ